MSSTPRWLAGARESLAEGLREPARRLDDLRARSARQLGFREGALYAPALVGGIALLWYAAGGARGRATFPAWWALASLPLLPLAFAIVRGYLARRAAPDTLTTARTLSARLSDHERLAAATELAQGEPGSGTFAHAAIEDGLLQLERAREAELAAAAAPPLRVGSLALALGLGVVPLVFQPERGAEDPDESYARTTSALPKPAASPRDGAATRASSRPEENPASRAETPVAATTELARKPAEERRETKKDEAERGGAAAAAGAAGASAESGAAQSKAKKQKGSRDAKTAAAAPGAAGSEAGAEAPDSPEPPRAQAPKKAPRTKPKEPKPPRAEPDAPKNGGGAQSGAARSGAQGSPVAAGQRLRDPVREGQQDANVEEDPAEDDPETSEQRGGASPPSRDRQKSPSRELTISGDGPPQDGRGGPTPPKKARGTASLILGVTVPDHVHGRPNPGTNKQSLADAPPREEAHALPAVAAASTTNPPHAQSPGTPRDWLAPFVLRYHELLRDVAARAPESAPNHDQRNR